MKRLIFLKSIFFAFAFCLCGSVFSQVGIPVNPNVAATVQCILPAQPGSIEFSTSSVGLGGTFTASVPSVAGLSYTWNEPSDLGLSITSGQGTATVTYQASMWGCLVGIGDISVYASNICGNSPVRTNTTTVTVTGATTVTGSIDTYDVYCYPAPVGCWMIENSKEGTYTATTYEGKTAGERGYYYTWTNAAAGACPSGYSLPTNSQWQALISYLTTTATAELKIPWYDANSLSGHRRNYTIYWIDWDKSAHYWSTTTQYAFAFYQNPAEPNFHAHYHVDDWMPVRCVKSN
ncbi:MAG: hypothetical protein LBS25_09220 [Candidatus Symbiothrix sp.]|nr:hypothetical protein [Candidatus Symbiothrix sp.]